MPITIQPQWDHTKILIDPRLDGKDGWTEAVCTWLSQYVNFNTNCPWSDSDKAAIGALLLGAGEPFQNWVAKWKTSNVRQVWLKFVPCMEWNLEIGAACGGGTSTVEYRVLDIATTLVGLDDDGNLTTMVCGRSPAPRPQIGASPAAPQTARMVPAPLQPQQVMQVVGAANVHLTTAGGNFNEALDRMAKLALRLGANRTQAALDQLVKVAGFAAAR